jgi:hypothetical protein
MKYVAQIVREKGNNNFLLASITDQAATQIPRGATNDIPIKYIYFGYSDFDVPPYLVAYNEPDGSRWGINDDEIYNTFEEARIAFFNKLFA